MLKGGTRTDKRGMLALVVEGISAHNRHNACMAYWQAGLSLMRRGQRYFSLRTDTSRVGYKPCQIIACALPGNVAFRLPPQAGKTPERQQRRQSRQQFVRTGERQTCAVSRSVRRDISHSRPAMHRSVPQAPRHH